MLLFLIRRLGGLVATILVATMVVFVLLELLPGDPASLMLGVNAQPDTIAALRAELGLDEPSFLRYLHWIGGMLTGDFGISYTYRVPVAGLIADRALVSLPLALMALALSTAIAIPLGTVAATAHNRWPDSAVMGFAQLGIAIPNFWFGILLVYLFAVTLQWVPAGGFAGWDAGPGPALRSLILPAVALALPQAAILARVMRSALLDVLHEDYVRTARAKGLPFLSTVWRHGVRNALIPVLTILGLQFAFLIAGTIIIENVFYLPGLGRLIFQAVAQRDLVVVQSLTVLLVASVVIVNFLVDLAYAAVDPRLRLAGR